MPSDKVKVQAKANRLAPAAFPEFRWSPLFPRHLAPRSDTVVAKDVADDSEQTIVQKENLYPNIDVSVWLRSCSEEVLRPVEGVSSGTIPKWLNGSLLRNGPGSLKVGNMTFDHLFDSSALLHRFAIADGRATYQNRFLQSQTFRRNAAARRIVVTEFGTRAVPDPCQSIFQR
ncbi:Carotenoid isomerooxygenase [Gryllus bimaculatus]|nr:Carotenoid isomerooxygenase [Gryllus bimaculatus]